MDGDSVSKIDLAYANCPIRFSLRSSHHKKNYSILEVDKQGLAVLLNRLQRLEDDFTWKTLGALGREGGLTKEKQGSESYVMIQEKKMECEGPDMGDDDYFYHLRVKDKDKQYSLFRLFGYQKKDLFCITHFDFKGVIHH